MIDLLYYSCMIFFCYLKDWIPILKEQWSTFMSYLQPRLQILAPTIVDVYHASKSFIAPHVFKVLENLFSYTQVSANEVDSYNLKAAFCWLTGWSSFWFCCFLLCQEAKKFVEAYMPRIALVTRSCFDKAFFALKWYIVNLFRACWKFITVSTLFHHQVSIAFLLFSPFSGHSSVCNIFIWTWIYHKSVRLFGLKPWFCIDLYSANIVCIVLSTNKIIHLLC